MAAVVAARMMNGTGYAGDSADVTVEYDGHECVGVGGVGAGVLVDVTLAGDSPALPVSALQLPAGTVFRC